MKLDMRIARLMAHMTQADVAKKMGVSAVMVHHWETGKCRMNDDRLAEYCAIIGRSPEDIFVPKVLN